MEIPPNLRPSFPNRTRPKLQLPPLVQSAKCPQNGTMPQTDPPPAQDQIMLQNGIMAQGILSPTNVPNPTRRYRLIFVPAPPQQPNGISCDQQQQSTSNACFADTQEAQLSTNPLAQLPNSNVPIRPRRSNKSCHQPTTKANRPYSAGNHAPATVAQQQQLRCFVCWATKQGVKKDIRISTTRLLFNGKPHCYRCYKFVYGQKDEIKANKYNNYTSCACANSGKSGQDLHDMCRANPKDRAGFMSIGCTICKLRLCDWIGFDINKIDTYATQEKPPTAEKKFIRAEELRSKSNLAIIKQMSAININSEMREKRIRSMAELRVICGADIIRLMSENVEIKEFIEMCANSFMQVFKDKGLAVEYLVGKSVIRKRPELREPSNWYVFSCYVVQLDDERVEAFLQIPLQGCQLNQENVPIRLKECHCGTELTDHLVDLETKHCIPYFNGAFFLKDISVNSLLAVLKYLERKPSVPFPSKKAHNSADFVDYSDQIEATVKEYVTPRAASLVLYNVECRQIGSMDCTDILEKLFNGFSCPLVLVEDMDRIMEFNFLVLQKCKQFQAANIVVFRKNSRNLNALNAAKIDAEAYVTYVNREWTFSSFVWAPQLSEKWASKSFKNGHRSLNYTVLEYLPTISADDEVCNMLANLVLTEPFLEDLFLGPGRMHYIDIELLSGLKEKILPALKGLTTIFTVLVDQLEQAFLSAKSVVPYTLFIAGPMPEPWPNPVQKPNSQGELFMVRLFELKKSDRLLVIVQRFLPVLSQTSTSSSSSSVAY